MRAITAVIGIALGAAVFTGVRLSVHASLNSFSRSMTQITGRSDLVVFMSGGRLPEEIFSRISMHPDVRGASAIMTGYVKPLQQDTEPFLLIGFDPIADRGFREWEVRRTNEQPPGGWLDLVARPYTLIAGDTIARANGWQTGDRVTLVHTRQNAAFEVIGLLESEGLALAEGGRVALTDIATFQEFTGIYGRVDRIDLKLTPEAAGRSLDDLRQRFKGLLVEGALLALPSGAKASGRGMIRAYQLNLSILSFVSLFVGMFLIYSLVALNAAARRHELAVMRSMGASSGHLLCLFLAEGACLGLLGWLLAIPLNSLLLNYLIQGVSRTISNLFVPVHEVRLQLDMWEVLLSFGLTMIVAVLAALQPAREAMRVAPNEALSNVWRQAAGHRSARRLAVVSVLLISLSWPLSRVPGYAGMPLAGYAAILALFIGFALLSPWGLQKLGCMLAPLLNRAAGISAYLAGRYVRDSGARTAISVGALITAVSLFAALVIMIHSFRGTVELWVRQTVSGDLFVTAKMSAVNRFRDAMAPAVVSGLQRLQSPVDVVASRRFTLKQGGFEYELDVMDLETFARHGRFVWIVGGADKVLPRVIAGEGVIVSEVFANRTGRGVGQTYEAQIGNHRLSLPILGMIRDYRTSGGLVFYHLPAFRQQHFDPGWSGARVFFQRPPDNPELAMSALRREIIERCGSHLDMVVGDDLRQAVLRIFDETFAVTTVLLLIALIVAALGITTTLAVQVLERSRQLNTLFAIGAGLRQIRAMIFWEAVLLIIAGELAGLTCGFILSYLLIYVVNVQSFGWSFIYRVDWQALLMSLPLIVATALLAALPAIRLIFKNPPAEMLRDQ